MNPTNPNGQLDFTDFPANMSLDDLFQDEPTSQATSLSQGTPELVAEQPQIAPATPQTPSWEPIKTTKSVYQTREEAIRGIEQKDTLLEQLRQNEIQRTGIDPFTQRQVVPQAQPVVPQRYLDNPDKYMQDLVNGAENNPRDYVNSQIQLFNEYLAPLGPAIQEIVKSRAEKSLTSQLPDFESVRSSPHFNAVLDELPDLKEAILGAENNFQAMDKLPGLYKIAYLAARGRQLPELLNAQAQPVPSATPTQARPAMSTSQGMPPSTPTPTPNPSTPEGRKAIIDLMEQRGVLDRKF